MQYLRTFIAIEVSSEVRSCAAELMERLRASGVRVSWTKLPNMHLTLKFLGDTPETLLVDVCRAVIEKAGFGKNFTHRTGHSIDQRDLHGSGPHIDNLETREERLLIPGVAFSIEPGIYIAGEIGMRSEVNMYLADGKAIVTPEPYQRDLIIAE